MNIRIVWSDQALQDLESGVDQLSTKSETAANNLFSSLFHRIDQLLTHPNSGQIELSLSHYPQGYRYLLEHHHKILYRLEGDTIFIIRIFDTRRDPKQLKP